MSLEGLQLKQDPITKLYYTVEIAEEVEEVSEEPTPEPVLEVRDELDLELPQKWQAPAKKKPTGRPRRK